MFKILFLFDSLECGGAEQALYDLLRLMDKRQFEVAIFVLKAGGVWEEKFRKEGVRILNADASSTCGGLLQKLRLRCARKYNGKGLLKAALKEKFDLVVSYMMWEQLATGFVSGVPAVCWFHWDVESNKAFRWIVNENRKLMMKYDRICCVSKAGQESLKSLIRRPVELHYNPIDSQRICKMAKEHRELPETPYTCAVGRMVPEKGFVRLVYVHKRLLEAGAHHNLVIVGDGPERENIENAIKETGTENSVILVGYQSNPYPYMKNSRFLVCSSFTEALPVISMEALSLGIPIVSAVPSIEEVFGEENCGIITDNDDDSLFAGMYTMLTDEDSYAKAKQGAENRSKFFDGNRMVKEVEDVFLELVK